MAEIGSEEAPFKICRTCDVIAIGSAAEDCHECLVKKVAALEAENRRLSAELTRPQSWPGVLQSYESEIGRLEARLTEAEGIISLMRNLIRYDGHTGQHFPDKCKYCYYQNLSAAFLEGKEGE